MAAVESRELVGAVRSFRILQCVEATSLTHEREQKGEQHLENARLQLRLSKYGKCSGT
jgi:hypothetical protein